MSKEAFRISPSIVSPAMFCKELGRTFNFTLVAIFVPEAQSLFGFRAQLEAGDIPQVIKSLTSDKACVMHYCNRIQKERSRRERCAKVQNWKKLNTARTH